MFNNLLRTVIASLLLACAAPLNGQQLSVDDPVLFSEIRDSTLTPFLSALKDGDVQVLRLYLSDDIYENEYKRLFESNENYPVFLREFYDGVYFEVRDITLQDNIGTAEIDVTWKDGRTMLLRLQLLSHADSRSPSTDVDRTWVVSSFLR